MSELDDRTARAMFFENFGSSDARRAQVREQARQAQRQARSNAESSRIWDLTKPCPTLDEVHSWRNGGPIR